MRRQERLNPPQKHNQAYIQTDARIKAAYLEIMNKEKRMPSQEEIAAVLKMSVSTISLHLNAIDLTEIIKPFKIFGTDVLNGLREKALSGSPEAIKLFFYLIFEWTEKREVNVKADVKAEVKGKVEVKHKLSPKIAKMLGDAIAEEKEEVRLKKLKDDS